MSVKKKSFEFLQVISLLSDLSYSMHTTRRNLENLKSSTKFSTPVKINHISELREIDGQVQKILKNAKKDAKIVKKLSPEILDKRKQAYLRKVKKVEKKWEDLEKKIDLAHSLRHPKNTHKLIHKTSLKPSEINQKSADVIKKDNMNKKDIIKKYNINAKDITEAKRKKKKIDKPIPKLKPKSAGKKTEIKKEFRTNTKNITAPKKPKPKPKPKPPTKPKGPRL